MVDLNGMTTEKNNPNSKGFSSLSVSEAVTLMNAEDMNAVRAVSAAHDQIVKVIEQSKAALMQGGRIIYTGAGTSGRLGVLDAVECPPTFGVDFNTVVGLIAGGENAFVKAKEGAEDSTEQGAADLAAIDLKPVDMVIGIAASGRTPYVLGALKYAMELGCPVGAIVCNTHSPIAALCPDTIELLPGPEVLTGSTRLKSGTATKMVLNMISTISMTGLGKIYGNYMVDVKMTNEKLVSRGIGIVQSLTGADQVQAVAALKASDQEVKTAIVMILTGSDADQARSLLKKAGGHIEEALRLAKQ
ncbi:N-acetylmuramic acid 6-phosphate etherase [Faecalibaculum rodentium]|uniref:N-acetylmuramic acid 6-phosphate etherase n=1 Tax=Faecalibaculum rodentium TaxID=1702221 RepID=A0A1Q9YLL0_9FIRM|nr:N-acetylmuramic acid 6-phosphate etherase [Faecalibaculum rodentium]OLU45764.1 N-acetylmuramic acid 6-phosphate etherase [Faecalibaculum rodentium]